MIRFLLGRTLELILTLLVIITITFFMLKTLPGSPFDGEVAVSEQVRAQLEKHYGLDQSVFAQYLIYLKNLSRGQFGSSYDFLGEPISSILIETIPVSLALGGMALVLSVSLGVLMGLLCLRYRWSWTDRFIMFLASSGMALPNFLLAPLLVLFFSFYLDLLPTALWEGPEYYILPVLALSIRPAAILARLIRASGLDSVQQDFVVMAMAKGVPSWKVYFKHVLPHSLIPALGVLGQIIAGLLSGSFVIEMVFAIPGAGNHLIQGVANRDYPMVMVMVIFYTFLLTISHWLIDTFMYWLDPRTRKKSC